MSTESLIIQETEFVLSIITFSYLIFSANPTYFLVSPARHRAVGGASNSQHLYGRAVDIRPVNPGSLSRFQTWLDLHWFGALGYGARRGFVHLDTRNGKGWRSGGQKGPRWNY
ncbi:MAG: D-Ala-D-Ala carboxypeptidase family metallohydrolase [Microcystis aeruginosa]|uniref:D-Ala-D-Ala carboxypeptidase family metallohydrolase n=1 Tax=Microcystis TaxID=1125 RepID=UPI0020A377DB|nr:MULTISPECIES: D-Ala-D-Ala carboxypeptidase family metallohydrolase [Microcystis]MDJ0530780.1 D-Ala-D-Ala carboxypeptidase family metallohydrolase [Microcystis sp. M53600_WE12]